MKAKIRSILVVLLIACAGFCEKGQAVNPPPDGGYSGGNTAEGTSALLSLTTGTYNTAIGIYSLLSLTDGNFCTGVGAGTLLVNTADQNTATGAGALLSNTTGFNNTANGVFTLFTNTEGNNNTANGALALFRNTTGADNTANGYAALESNTTSGGNTANGSQALLYNTTGFLNTAIGYQALLNNTGNGNTALGYLAGSNLTNGDDNICIGNVGVAGDGGTIRIGESFIGATYIAGIFGQISVDGAPVLVSAVGKLGTIVSSARFKQNIQNMGDSSHALMALRPVTFRYKSDLDPKGIPQFGLVAEEVEKVNPALVVRDKEGKPYTVRHDQVNAMLLNEFLKEHRKVEAQQSKIEQQEATIAQLTRDFQSKFAQQERRIEALAFGLQKVSGQIETSVRVPQAVAHNP